MDFERNQRRQSIRIIVSEAIMVLAVVIMVALLAFAASGYWFNADFGIERQGMLQISSIPTGANVEIDGSSSWLQKTNTSKVLSVGEHMIVLTKEGYDTWSKEITISEGLLYRIHYPRLFLKERFVEKLFSIEDITSATISSNHETLMLMNNTTEWKYFNLSDENLVAKKVDVSNIFPSDKSNTDEDPETFGGEITRVKWGADGKHLLIEARFDEKKEWALLDLDDAKNSINLTKEFNVDFSAVEILDYAANSLLAVRNNNLHKIDVRGRSISAVLVEDVVDFDHYNNEVFFSASLNQKNDDSEDKYYVGSLKLDGDSRIKKLSAFSRLPKVAIAKFYEDKLILVVEENVAKLYDSDGFSELETYELGFVPQTIKVGHEGEFIVMRGEHKSIATLVMETKSIHEWFTDSEDIGWLDNDMIYSVSEGSVIVYDYDGSNRRAIANGVSSWLPVGITDNRYLYYFADDHLIREWLIPR